MSTVVALKISSFLKKKLSFPSAIVLVPSSRKISSNKKNKQDDAPQTMRESYQQHSGNQYSAHEGCQDMVEACMERWSRRIRFEEQHMSMSYCDEGGRRKRTIADLGSADGSSSIKTLSVALQSLRLYNHQPSSNPLEIVFEDHPSSDEGKLRQTLERHEDWFQTNNATHRVLMKSFYEPLFESESMDFIMSYLCLHWLDTTDQEFSVSTWKALHDDKDNDKMKIDISERDHNDNDSSFKEENFVFINERSAPAKLQEVWRKKLANLHLAKFLALRSQELRPGAELFVVMVANPHEFVRPPNNGCSPLTTALERCIERGTVRKEVLEKTIIPYYQREVQDVHDALDLATAAGSFFLELVDIRSYETITGDGSDDGACNLFWAIHGGAVMNTGGATEEESISIQTCLREVFDEIYDPNDGIRGTFIACVFRKRTRKAWGA